MTREDREANIEDVADRIRILVENWSSDLHRDEGVEVRYALKLAMAGVRRVAREGLETPEGESAR